MMVQYVDLTLGHMLQEVLQAAYVTIVGGSYILEHLVENITYLSYLLLPDQSLRANQTF